MTPGKIFEDQTGGSKEERDRVGYSRQPQVLEETLGREPEAAWPAE